MPVATTILPAAATEKGRKGSFATSNLARPSSSHNCRPAREYLTRTRVLASSDSLESSSSMTTRRSPSRERAAGARTARSEEHTSELQSLMRISYAVFCLKKQPKQKQHD